MLTQDGRLSPWYVQAGRTALHFAAYYSNTYMLSLLLLAENADLESVDEVCQIHERKIELIEY